MWPAEFLQDVRYGLRTLAKNPGFTIVAIAALALGIGANTAIFSVVNSVLLRPLPFKDPNQLVMVWDEQTHLGFPKDTPTPANFLDWQRQNSVFVGMAAMAQRSFNLTGNGEPERLDGRRISANLFDLLGIQPQLGRNFRPEEDTPGTRVVILTSFPDDEAVLSAIVAGAAGYLLKQIRARDLISALEAVGRGKSLLDPAVTEKVLQRVRQIANGEFHDELSALTPQERKILLLVAEGKTN